MAVVYTLETPQKPEVLISNLSLPLGLMRGGAIPEHEVYVEGIGADGLELTPTYVGHFMTRLLYRLDPYTPADQPRKEDQSDQQDDRPTLGYEDRTFKRLVRALHSSFRNTNDDNGYMARKVPTWTESLEHMKRIQDLTGPLPAVLYPGFEDGKVMYDNGNAPFAERTIQPTAWDWEQMGLHEGSDVEDVEAVLASRGITGLTFDVFHSQRPGKQGERFKDPLELAQRLAAYGLINSVHMALNRLDTAGGPRGYYSQLARSTRQARASFVHSAEKARKTLEGELLLTIADGVRLKRDPRTGLTRQLARIVLEDGPLRLATTTQDRRDHAAIVGTIRQLLNEGIRPV